jgi:two-component system sensor histidine kinase GlrK
MKSLLTTFGNRFLAVAHGLLEPFGQASLNPKALVDRLFSLKYLVAAGFLVTMIPVAIALTYAGLGMRETASLGEQALHQTAEQMNAMRLVLQQVNDIERKAKLFVLLSDPSLRQPYERESYENVRASFRQTTDELLKQSLDNRLTLLITELLEKERLIHDQITAFDVNDNPKLPVEEAFRGLREAANELWQEVTGRVSRQAEGLHLQAGELEQRLLVRTLALMTFSVGFFIVFMAVLHRSIRRLDQAIRKLGSGRFGDPIAVQGPRDLRLLGDRLEWLRIRLLDLEQAKYQFMQNVTREIEAPLEAIRNDSGQLQAMAGQTVDPEVGERCDRLGQNAGKLQSVCEELVRYSQLNENPVLGERRGIDLKQLYDAAVATLRPQIETKALRLKALVQPVPFHGIAEQMQGIFEQLLSNAVKFSPERGEVRILLRSSKGSIEFEIEDDGPGFAADELQQVLKPFFRGRAALEQDTEGTGLGLAMVSEYLVHCQGRIEIVEPREDRHGARIRIHIPIVNLD